VHLIAFVTVFTFITTTSAAPSPNPSSLPGNGGKTGAGQLSWPPTNHELLDKRAIFFCLKFTPAPESPAFQGGDE